MFQMNRIGTVEKQGQQLQVMLHGPYKKAMKHMEKFSHIHLFVIAGDDRLTRITGKVGDIDFRDGTVDLEWNCDKSRVTDCDFPLALIDMKPYLPSVDYAITDDCGGINTGEFLCSRMHRRKRTHVRRSARSETQEVALIYSIGRRFRFRKSLEHMCMSSGGLINMMMLYTGEFYSVRLPMKAMEKWVYLPVERRSDPIRSR